MGGIAVGDFGISMRAPCILLGRETGSRVLKFGHEVCERFDRDPDLDPFGPIQG